MKSHDFYTGSGADVLQLSCLQGSDDCIAERVGSREHLSVSLPVGTGKILTRSRP